MTQNQNFPHNIKFFEVSSNLGHIQPIATPPSASAFHQIAVIGAGQSKHPTLVGINKKNSTIIILDPQLSHATTIPLRAVAVSEMDQDHFIIATPDNDIFTLDVAFNVNKYIDSSLIPKHVYGKIVRMQFLDSYTLAVLTETHLLNLDVQDANHRIWEAHDLRSFKNHNWKFTESSDLVATSSGAWVLTYMQDANLPGDILEQPIYIDFLSGSSSMHFIGHQRSISASNGFNYFQFLDMDQLTDDLIFKSRWDYLRYNTQGQQVDGHAGFYAPQALLNRGLPPTLGTALHVTVDQHRSALHWMPRAQNNGSSLRLGSPYLPLGALPAAISPLPAAVLAATRPIPPSPAKAPALNQTSVAATSPVKDYTTEEDFLNLMKRELHFDAQSGSVPVDEFVEMVNRSELQIIRYYFQTVKSSELAQLGMALQGFWLATIPNSSIENVTPTQVAGLLAKGRQREIAACKKSLGEP